MGSPTAMLARKMLAAKGTDNRQIADGNIALLLSPPFRKTLSIPFRVRPIAGAATRRRLVDRREDARRSVASGSASLR